MAGCVPCFVIPLLLFIFHRYIQPILLKFWNPWDKKPIKEGEEKKCEFSCDCSWKAKEVQDQQDPPENTTLTEGEKLKAS